MEGEFSFDETVVATDVVRLHDGSHTGSGSECYEGLRPGHSSPRGVDSPSDPAAGSSWSGDEGDGER